MQSPWKFNMQKPMLKLLFRSAVCIGKPAEASMHIHHKDPEHIYIPLYFYL